jgi:hypothetical protein
LPDAMKKTGEEIKGRLPAFHSSPGPASKRRSAGRSNTTLKKSHHI